MISFLYQIYQSLFYKPIFKLLLLIYQKTADFGLSIIFLTFLIRIFLFPLSWKGFKAQKRFAKVQKEILKIRKKISNSQKQAQEILKVYQSFGGFPLFSLLLPFLQLPILIALYELFLKGFKTAPINPYFLKIVNLSRPNLTLVLIWALLQLLASSFLKKQTKNYFFSNFLSFIFPLFLIFILLKLPSAIALYLIFSTIFGILEGKLYEKEVKRRDKKRD